jgi:nicotinamidase-related amidase
MSNHRDAIRQAKGRSMSKRAVIVVDIQNDYFPEGKYSLVNIEQAAANAAKVIAAARDKGDEVIHVQHVFPDSQAPFFAPETEGVKINPAVEPRDGEALVVKNHPNSFLKTDLKDRLDAKGIKEVVVVGAMSHMCIDATARAASDFGYRTTVVQDACATRDLAFGGVTVPAAQVHAAMMSALGFAYATITDTDAYIQRGIVNLSWFEQFECIALASKPLKIRNSRRPEIGTKLAKPVKLTMPFRDDGTEQR